MTSGQIDTNGQNSRLDRPMPTPVGGTPETRRIASADYTADARITPERVQKVD